jgi:hypothetical protein
MASQERESGSAFSDARLHVDSHVKIVRFLPQTLRIFGVANFIFEYREATNGVREVERPPVFMTAIDRKGFDVARFG